VQDEAAFREDLDEILKAQDCLTGPTSPRNLARAEFERGVSWFGGKDKEAARASFEQVAAVEPDVPWVLDSCTTPVQALFFQSVSQVLAQTPAEITVASPEGAQVLVDGRPLAAWQTHPLRPGRHLLQVLQVDSQPFVVSFGADPGDSGLIWIPGALNVGPEDVGQDRIREVLGSLPADTAPEYIVSLAHQEVWLWDEERRQLQDVCPIPREPQLKPQERSVVPALFSGVGAGLLVAGAVVTGVGWGNNRSYSDARENGTITFEDESNEEDRVWGWIASPIYFGYGLMGAGGATLAVSIPLQVRRSRRNEDPPAAQ